MCLRQGRPRRGLFGYCILGAGYPKHLITDTGLNNRGLPPEALSAVAVDVGTSDWKRHIRWRTSNGTVIFGNVLPQMDRSRKLIAAHWRVPCWRLGILSTGPRDTGNRWSLSARGFVFQGYSRKLSWVVCEGIPFCIAVCQERPAGDAH